MTPQTENVLVVEIDAEQAAEQQRAVAAQQLQQMEADVSAWHKRIEDARDFDKEARKTYARDRLYCQNKVDPAFDVAVPIAGTYVNILTGFLYARDPEPSVQPAESVGSSRIKDAKDISRTLEIVITHLWKKGKLKSAADQMVRSSLSIGIGWIKAAWHTEMGKNPLMVQQIDDLRAKIQALHATERQINSGDAPNPDELMAQYQQQMQGLEAQAEKVIYNGLCIDFVRGEDMQVAPAAGSLKDYVSSPWIAHRSFMPMEDAKAAFPDVADKLSQAEQFHQVKPADRSGNWGTTDAAARVSETDADSFRTSATPGSSSNDQAAAHICIWEIWDRTTGTVITISPGLKAYLRPPYVPDQKSSRFYPFFSWAPLWVDGQRHPQSLVDRSRSLLDEYNRTRTNYREHRRRAIPKLGFDAGLVEKEEAKKMEAGAIGEMVGLNLNGQAQTNVLFPIQYNQIDSALYDTSVIRAELELVWGIQEALSSSIQTAKTATEADIQQQGTESRLGYNRDSLDEVFGDLAQYTAEEAMSPNGLGHDEAVRIAGPEAMWPKVEDVSDLETMVAVDIRAGSSGRPANALRRQQWATILPQLQQAVMTIGQLRQAPASEIADSLEQLVVETIQRTGDTSIDPYTFIPQPQPQAAMGDMIQPGISPDLGAAALLDQPAPTADAAPSYPFPSAA